MVCINQSSEQARWLKWSSKMCIGEKKLHFILSDCTFKDALLGQRQFATEGPLKMTIKAFYFTLKALFVRKIFKFLS